MLSKKMIFMLVGLTIGAWFLMGGQKSALEKLTLLILLFAAYLGFRLLTGATFDEIIAPFMLESSAPPPDTTW